MSETSSVGGKRSNARPVVLRASAQRAQERRRTALVNASMLVLMLAAAVLVIGAVLPKLGQPNASMAPGQSEDELRSATITRNADTGCAQQAFDNQTGRMTSSPRPCPATVYDSNGVPVPVGTIRRLDSISKSFPGR